MVDEERITLSQVKWFVMGALFLGLVIGIVFGMSVHGSVVQACRDAARESMLKTLGNVTSQIQYGVLK